MQAKFEWTVIIGEMAKKQERNDDELLLLFQGMNVSGNNESAKNIKKKAAMQPPVQRNI